MDQQELENRFTYHSPTADQIPKYGALRDMAKAFAELISELVPGSREQSLAITNLETAVMFANAGIARRTSDVSSDEPAEIAAPPEPVEPEAVDYGKLIFNAQDFFGDVGPSMCGAMGALSQIAEILGVVTQLRSIQTLPDRSRFDALDWPGFFAWMSKTAKEYEEDSGEELTYGEFLFTLSYAIREKLLTDSAYAIRGPGQTKEGNAYLIMTNASGLLLAFAKWHGCDLPPKIRFPDNAGGSTDGISVPE